MSEERIQLTREYIESHMGGVETADRDAFARTLLHETLRAAMKEPAGESISLDVKVVLKPIETPQVDLRCLEVCYFVLAGPNSPEPEDEVKLVCINLGACDS